MKRAAASTVKEHHDTHLEIWDEATTAASWFDDVICNRRIHLRMRLSAETVNRAMLARLFDAPLLHRDVGRLRRRCDCSLAACPAPQCDAVELSPTVWPVWPANAFDFLRRPATGGC